MGHLSYQCDKLLEDKETVSFLQRQQFDIIVLDAFNPCSFILARKLGTVPLKHRLFLGFISSLKLVLSVNVTTDLNLTVIPGVQYIAFYPGSLNGPLSITLPSPVSYIPVFSSQLSDHMNLWGRVKNLFYATLAPVGKTVMTEDIVVKRWRPRSHIWRLDVTTGRVQNMTPLNNSKNAGFFFWLNRIKTKV